MSAEEALLAVLANVDLLDADGVHRGARADRCRDCRRPVLRGLDADRAALAAVVDPHEIDAMGELIAKRIGLMTYNLSPGYSSKGIRRWELSPRAACMIEAPRRTAVLVAHRCGLAIPPAAVTFLSPTPRPACSVSDAPPF